MSSGYAVEFVEQVLIPIDQDDAPQQPESPKQTEASELEIPAQYCKCDLEEETASESDSVYSWNDCSVHPSRRPYPLKRIRSMRTKRPRKKPMGPKLEWELIHPYGPLQPLQCCKFCQAVFPEMFYYAERARFIEDFPDMPEYLHPAKEPHFSKMSPEFARRQFPPFEPCVRSYKDPKNCTTCGCWFGRTPQGILAAQPRQEAARASGPPPHDGSCDGGWACEPCSQWYEDRDRKEQEDEWEGPISFTHESFDQFFNERWSPESKIHHKEESYESYLRWLREYEDGQCNCSWCRPGLYAEYEYLMDGPLFPWLGYRFIAQNDARSSIFKSMYPYALDKDMVQSFMLKDLRRDSDVVAKKRRRDHMQKYSASRKGKTGVRRPNWADALEDIGENYKVTPWPGQIDPLANTGFLEYHAPVLEQPKRSYRNISDRRKKLKEEDRKEVVRILPTKNLNLKEKGRKLVDYCRSHKMGICCQRCSRVQREWGRQEDKLLWRTTWGLAMEDLEGYWEGEPEPGRWVVDMEEPIDYMGCSSPGECPICDCVSSVWSTPEASVVGEEDSVVGDFEVLESISGGWEEVEVEDDNSSTFSWPNSEESEEDDPRLRELNRPSGSSGWGTPRPRLWAWSGGPWEVLVDRALEEFERKRMNINTHN